MATLGDPVSYDRVEIRTASLKAFPGFSIPDESSTTNPARFTFHNISMTNNPSPVKCSDPSTEEESTAVIIVEGERCHVKLKHMRPVHCYLSCFKGRTKRFITFKLYSYICDCI